MKVIPRIQMYIPLFIMQELLPIDVMNMIFRIFCGNITEIIYVKQNGIELLFAIS